MDEITALQDARPEVEADTQAQEAARTRLYAEFRREHLGASTKTGRSGSSRLPRPAVAASLVGATAVFVLAAGMIVPGPWPHYHPGQGTSTPAADSPKTWQPERTDQSKAQVAKALTMAANAVDRSSTSTTPPAKQWIYFKAMNVSEDEPNGSVREEWHRVDGKKSAKYHGDWLAESNETATEDHGNMDGSDTVGNEYRRLQRSMGGDPGEARQAIYRASEALDADDWGTRDDRAYSYLMEAFEDSPVVPPSVLANFYRTLSTIPGVHIDKDITDGSGRHGIGVYRTDVKKDEYGPRMTQMLILSKKDHQVIGQRGVVAEDYTYKATPGKRVTDKSGTVSSDTVVLRSGIVDEAGQRP